MQKWVRAEITKLGLPNKAVAENAFKANITQQARVCTQKSAKTTNNPRHTAKKWRKSKQNQKISGI